MKMKKIALSIAALSFLVIPSVVSADEDDFSWLDKNTWSVEASGEIKSTIGAFTTSGSTHNPKMDNNGVADTHDAGDLYRSEITAKLFLNQEIGEETSWHAGLQANKDGNAEDGYDFTRSYSQFDWLRELYVDTTSGDFSFRIGKQQVVWGKADGVKFLDIINPTDFRHWGQDSMEDSRIPLWMLKAEYTINSNSSLQLVYVPQVDVTNQIPGLYNTNTGDAGEEFVPLGMDTMFGRENGFMNIGPDMGKVAQGFTGGFNQLMTIDQGYKTTGTPSGVQGALGADGLKYFQGMTVNMFVQAANPSNPNNPTGDVNGMISGMVANAGGLFGQPNPTDQNGMATGDQMLGGTIQMMGATTNLFGTALNTASPTTMFDYMGDTTFATFDTFQGMRTKHVKAHADNEGAGGNLGIRYSGTNDSIGLNYTFNYYYHYDNNPVIDVSWEGNTGNVLTTQEITTSFDATGNPSQMTGQPEAYKTTTMVLMDGNNQYKSTDALGNSTPATMVFTERQNRINTFGTSFDYGIETPFAPVILRSEIVYDKDTLQPVVDLGKLAYGDLAGAFQNEKASFLNYVVGLDVTVMTNLFVSVQFMDKWNLDYQDEQVQYDGNSRAYGKFTANPATMSLANGFKKAEEHQIMYTFFLSKPFMESDALRVNNIFLYENENGGYWDRFDLEYSYSDAIILSAAVNQYGGDKYGVFGQFEKMSNAQVGFKYIF